MDNIQAVNSSLINEINLNELVKKLWQEKITILLCTIVITLSAIIYAFSAQQWWTSKAIISGGQYQNTVNIRNKIANLYSVLTSNGQVQQLNRLISSKQLLEEYVVAFNAYDNKEAFIENNQIMKDYALKAEVSEENISSFTSFWAKKVSISQLDKDNPDVFEMSFEATTPELAYELLSSYSKFIATKVQDDLLAELNAIIQHNIHKLNAQEVSLIAQAKVKLKSELVKTDYALDIASSAKVSKPLSNLNNSGIFQIDLGAEALNEKSKILSKIEDLSIFEPKISTTKIKLDLLSEIKLDKDTSLQSIRFLKKIAQPLSRERPKRLLILLLGVIGGLFTGVFVTILKLTYRKPFQE